MIGFWLLLQVVWGATGTFWAQEWHDLAFKKWLLLLVENRIKNWGEQNWGERELKIYCDSPAERYRGLDEDGSEKWSNSGPIFKRELTNFHDWSEAIETANLLACFPYKTKFLHNRKSVLLSLDPLY